MTQGRKAGKHRIRVTADGTEMCGARLCGFTGTSDEVYAHVRFGFRITQGPDGMWVGPANITAASLGDLLNQLVPSRA